MIPALIPLAQHKVKMLPSLFHLRNSEGIFGGMSRLRSLGYVWMA